MYPPSRGIQKSILNNKKIYKIIIDNTTSLIFTPFEINIPILSAKKNK
jgi:hypothetical protein